MSAECSPLRQVVPALPVRPLVTSTQAVNLRRLNDELVGRVRKPPDVSEHWLLEEVINKNKREGRQTSLPVSRPMAISFVCGRQCTAFALLPADCFARCHFSMVSAWADSRRPTNAELVWHACCKPPDVRGTIRQLSAGVISANAYTSVTHSPVYGIAHMPPVHLLTSSPPISETRRPDNELVARVRKPPDPAARHWLLDEAINNMAHIRLVRPLLFPHSAHFPRRLSFLRGVRRPARQWKGPVLSLPYEVCTDIVL